MLQIEERSMCRIEERFQVFDSTVVARFPIAKFWHRDDAELFVRAMVREELIGKAARDVIDAHSIEQLEQSEG